MVAARESLRKAGFGEGTPQQDSDGTECTAGEIWLWQFSSAFAVSCVFLPFITCSTRCQDRCVFAIDSFNAHAVILGSKAAFSAGRNTAPA